MRNFNKIFGIGFPRTGTCSLAAALYELGIDFVHYPVPLSVVDEYRGGCDITVTFEYEKLYEKYPNSLFIFTERTNFKAFHKSLCKIFPNFQHYPKRLFNEADGHTEEGLADAYMNHLSNVLKFFHDKKDRLLLLNIVEQSETAGEKLCNFLEVPNTLQDFPKLNSDMMAKTLSNVLIKRDGFVKYIDMKNFKNIHPDEPALVKIVDSRITWHLNNLFPGGIH